MKEKEEKLKVMLNKPKPGLEFNLWKTDLLTNFH